MPLVAFALAGCVTGSAVVTGEKQAPAAFESIEVYLEPPDSFRTIGTVEARAEVVFSRKAAGERAIRELKKQAAALGATGVILAGPPEKVSVPRVVPSSDDDDDHEVLEIEEEFIVVTGRAVIVDP